MKGIVKLLPIFLVFTLMSFVGAGLVPDCAEAKAKFGGKMYKSAPKSSPKQKQPATSTQKPGGFGKGLAGGLLGGAIGGLLFGSMMGGEGMGILPILLLAGVGFFLFKRMGQSQQRGHGGPRERNQFGQMNQQTSPYPTDFGQTTDSSEELVDISIQEGIDQICENDPGFDKKYFQEVASDIFFQVQAGWMRKDLASYTHLLGETLRAEYANHFQEMNDKGIVNKLESIAVRGVDIVEAGSDGKEDFITILFTASLLDYTMNEKSGEIIEGSDTTPVKFTERWTWARPVKSEEWKLEGVHAE